MISHENPKAQKPLPLHPRLYLGFGAPSRGSAAGEALSLLHMASVWGCKCPMGNQAGDVGSPMGMKPCISKGALLTSESCSHGGRVAPGPAFGGWLDGGTVPEPILCPLITMVGPDLKGGSWCLAWNLGGSRVRVGGGFLALYGDVEITQCGDHFQHWVSLWGRTLTFLWGRISILRCISCLLGSPQFPLWGRPCFPLGLAPLPQRGRPRYPVGQTLTPIAAGSHSVLVGPPISPSGHLQPLWGSL